ncbi:MAG: hypothetical protein ACRDXD_09970 [Acidimicrobiia bacterium]
MHEGKYQAWSEEELRRRGRDLGIVNADQLSREELAAEIARLEHEQGMEEPGYTDRG